MPRLGGWKPHSSTHVCTGGDAEEKPRRYCENQNIANLALEMDFLVEVNEFFHPFHRLHTAIALLYDLRNKKKNDFCK